MLALASTPPAVLLGLRRADTPLRAACLSDGPLWSFDSQWSPTFSKLCLSDANAVRRGRSPSPYSFIAESYVFAQVRCAFFDERATVLGIALRAGIGCSLPCGFARVDLPPKARRQAR